MPSCSRGRRPAASAPTAARGRPAACLPLGARSAAARSIDGTAGMTLAVRRCTAGRRPEPRGAARRLGAGRAPGRRRVPLDRAALLGCAALTGVGAVLFAARCRGRLDGARDRRGRRRPVRRPGRGDRRGLRDRLLRPGRRSDSSSRNEARRDARSSPEELAERGEGAFPEGFDYAFDAVGNPETTKAASAGRERRALRVVGLPAAGARLDLDPTEFIRREKRLTGTIYGSEDPAVALPILLDHVAGGRLDLATQVGPSFSLDDVNDAVDGGARRRRRVACSCSSDGGRAASGAAACRWVDTDAGGRIHFTAAFRWAEAAETALMRRMGLLEGWADYPRKHVEAQFLRVLRFEDEIRRAPPRRVRRADVDHVRLDDREGGRESDRGRHTVVHVDRGRHAGNGAGRDPRGARMLESGASPRSPSARGSPRGPAGRRRGRARRRARSTRSARLRRGSRTPPSARARAPRRRSTSACMPRRTRPELLVRVAVERHGRARLELDHVQHRAFAEEGASGDAGCELERPDAVEVDEACAAHAGLSTLTNHEVVGFEP